MSLQGKKMMQRCFQIKQITQGIEDIPNNPQSSKYWVSKLTIEIAFQHVM